jgi:hypothetical protein
VQAKNVIKSTKFQLLSTSKSKETKNQTIQIKSMEPENVHNTQPLERELRLAFLHYLYFESPHG